MVARQSFASYGNASCFVRTVMLSVRTVPRASGNLSGCSPSGKNRHGCVHRSSDYPNVGSVAEPRRAVCTISSSVVGIVRHTCVASVESHMKSKRERHAEATARWRQRHPDRFADRIATINSLKDVPCKDCGGRFPSECMDFDHVRGPKLFNVGTCSRNGVSETRLDAEIAKCEIVCANCHRIRTKKRRTQ